MTWTRTAAWTVAGTLPALLLVTALAAPVAAASNEPTPDPPGQARFEGRDIDLERGWGDARTCVVWMQDGATECFRTEQAADAAMQRHDRVAAARTAAALATWSLAAVAAPGTLDRLVARAHRTRSCGDWLTLYEHVGYEGRSLRFRDRGFYQDLADWGFANRTSSYRVGSCPMTLRNGTWDLNPGPAVPFASVPRMAPGWNDRIRYLQVR